MKYNTKINEDPKDVAINYLLTVIDAHIISQVADPQSIRDYVLTCMVEKSSFDQEGQLITEYLGEIKLSKNEIEKLREKQQELERELCNLSQYTLESLDQKLEIEKRLRILGDNLRTIDEHLKRFEK